MTEKRPKLELFTQKEKLEAGESRTVDVLVRITPPAAAETNGKRPRLNLSMVLDRSGSMQGRKIYEAREAAKYCIDQLLATDRISTVIFDDQIEVLIPSQPVENKEMLKRAIGSIHVANSTALHEAWVRGGLQVSDHLDPQAINRVLLITDGQANVGETNVDTIVQQTRRLAAKGVSTSTIGIGEDFNENLLLPMAEAGQGNAWHVQEPQDMVRIFETEMKGLIAQTGHTVKLNVTPADSVTVAGVLNDFRTDEYGRYQLPNLQGGSTMDIVVQLNVPANIEGAKAALATFELSYVDQALKYKTISAAIEVEFGSAESVASLPDNPEVVKAVRHLMNGRALEVSLARLNVGDRDGASNILFSALGATFDACLSSPSPMLKREIEELYEIKEALEDEENDIMSRKRMAYGRESIRKGK
jgi:Ca-activated chloride channel family protein